MCTLSWLIDREGYSLWFNRDELHTRSPEIPPQEMDTAEGGVWLAPLDPESRGTWLMTNQYGVTVVLLNDYGSIWSPPPAQQLESRGRLVPMTAHVRSAGEAIAGVLAGTTFERTPPFNLVAVDGAGGVARLHWDGAATRVSHNEDVVAPMTSSSYRCAHVEAVRKRAFPRGANAWAITAYHHGHDTEAAAESVNMSRGDAATRSISMVRVGPEWVILDYEPQNWPGAPRVNGGPRQWRLPRHLCSAAKQE